MLGPPVDAWYTWLGVATVSAAALTVVLGVPATAPPDATAAADAIDEVATSPPGATATHPLGAEQLRLDRRRIGLRGPGGAAHAALAFGPMTPALADERLAAVLRGSPPSTAFEHPATLARVAESARAAAPSWRRAPDRLRIRRVGWEGVNVLLVG